MDELLEGCLLQAGAMLSGMLGLSILLTSMREVALGAAPVRHLIPGAALVALSAYLFATIYRSYVISARVEAGFRRLGSATPAAEIQRYVPECLRHLELGLDSTVEDVKRAYRTRARELHPDVGGDTDRFIELESHYRAALEVVQRRQRLRQPAAAPGSTAP